jgi:L-alanine-DL-glutamate epimerase-like enolase superfamily enzyme
VRISALRATPLALKLKAPYHWAGRVDDRAANLPIEVETGEGITGYGERPRWARWRERANDTNATPAPVIINR